MRTLTVLPGHLLTPLRRRALRDGLALVGFRHPWTWSLMLLTKVTPGIACCGSLVAASGARWSSPLARPPQNATSAPTDQLIALQLWTRVALAAALLLWGGRTDHPWTVPVAVVLALPHGTIGLAVLGALVPMLAAGWRGSWSTLVGRPGRAVSADHGSYPAAHAPGCTP
ncbi:MAG: hypothetical protein ACR2LP_07225 [Candidatus Limnocylindrales bacterium]